MLEFVPIIHVKELVLYAIITGSTQITRLKTTKGGLEAMSEFWQEYVKEERAEAEAEGHAEGMAVGRAQTLLNAIEGGMDKNTIITVLKYTEEEYNQALSK